MNVSETCSCGATFSAEGDNVVRLLREWRKEHTCKPVDGAENDATVLTGADTKTETIGFQRVGWQIDLPEQQGFDE